MPRPVLPVNNKFFSSGLSNPFIKLFTISLITIIFCFGESFERYLLKSTSSEYKLISKFPKFSLSRFPIFDLLKFKSKSFCCIQLQRTLLPFVSETNPVSLQIKHSY